MNKDYKILPATSDDIEKAAEIIAGSIKLNPKGFRAVPDESHADFINRLIKQGEEGKGAFLVGKLGDEIVAVGGLDHDGYCPIESDDVIPEVSRVHVSANYQGEGYGKALVAALKDLAKQRGYGEIQLHVTKTQEAAIAIYDKLGFQVYHDKDCSRGDGLIFPTLFYRCAIAA